MNLLIIGCEGFIGKNLFNFFKTKNKKNVFGCDVIKKENAANYFFIESAEKGFDLIFRDHQFDLCINCSGAASVPDSLIDPWRDYELNTINVFRVLDAIRQHQPSCKFINLSSAAIYGNPKKLPISEADEPAPVSPYGFHKLQAEEICSYFTHYWDIKTCSLRIFSAFGPGLKKQLFWDLYQKSLQGSKVELHGTGNETRDFIFIDDITQAINLVMEKTEFKAECINVANGIQCRIEDSARIFFDTLGWKGEVNFNGKVREGDPLNWEADISVLKKMGYKQQFDMKKGLEIYTSWLKETQ